jgi:hypothetical protein
VHSAPSATGKCLANLSGGALGVGSAACDAGQGDADSAGSARGVVIATARDAAIGLTDLSGTASGVRATAEDASVVFADGVGGTRRVASTSGDAGFVGADLARGGAAAVVAAARDAQAFLADLARGAAGVAAAPGNARVAFADLPRIETTGVVTAAGYTHESFADPARGAAGILAAPKLAAALVREADTPPAAEIVARAPCHASAEGEVAIRFLWARALVGQLRADCIDAHLILRAAFAPSGRLRAGSGHAPAG